MITKDLPSLKINKLTQEQYNAALAAGTINEDEIYLTPAQEYTIKTETLTTTLTASTWNKTAKTYSFESTYPFAQYDVSIQPDKSCTTAQLDAYTAMKPLGSADSNVITAGGVVPSINIPIIIKAVKK